MNDDAYEDGMEHIDVFDNGDAATEPASRTRITTPFMTKYERARILGTRALQIRWVCFDGGGQGFYV